MASLDIWVCHLVCEKYYYFWLVHHPSFVLICRYCLYSRWKNEAGERIPALMRVRGNALQRIKHIMKRVSKENIKPQGRLIGKLSHAAPAFLFDYMLLQVIIFTYNFVQPLYKIGKCVSDRAQWWLQMQVQNNVAWRFWVNNYKIDYYND